MNICYDCGKPIEPNKPHNHNTFVTIRGEKQALKDRQKIGAFYAAKSWAQLVPIIVVVSQNERE